MAQVKNLRDPEGNEAKNLRLASNMAGKAVLEVGCGSGWLTRQISPFAGRLVGIDPGVDDLRAAKIDQPGEVTNTWFTAAISEALPFSACSFDLAFFSNSL